MEVGVDECLRCGGIASISDKYLVWNNTARDTGSQTGSNISWSVMPDEIVDRFIHVFNIKFIEVNEWHYYTELGLPGNNIRATAYRLQNSGVASHSGGTNNVNLTWLRTNPWDIDCMTHEFTHHAQNGLSNVPVWLFEGVTDYLREPFGIFNEEENWRLIPFASPTAHFENGYRVTGSFLKWIERTYYPNFVQVLHETYKPSGQTLNHELQPILDLNGNPIARINRYWSTTQHNGGTQRNIFIQALGKSVEDLWDEYFAYSFQYWTEAQQQEYLNRPIELRTITALANELAKTDRVLIPGETFVRGGNGFANEGPANLFNRNFSNKYCSNGVSHGMFFAEWRYATQVNATAIILGTAGDCGSTNRRMGNGWRVLGRNSEADPWELIYTGMTDDYRRVNNQYHIVPFENDKEFQFYRLESPTHQNQNPGGSGTDRTIQLSQVMLATTTAPVTPTELAAMIAMLEEEVELFQALIVFEDFEEEEPEEEPEE